MTNPDSNLRNFLGSIVNLRMSANDNADGISVIEHKMPRGEAIPLHVHKTQDEVFHVLRGQIRFEVGNQTFIAYPGDVFVAPKGVPHRFIVESNDGAHCMTITRGKDFETMVVENSSPIMVEMLPAMLVPTGNQVAALEASCNRNNIEIIGPPLAA